MCDLEKGEVRHLPQDDDEQPIPWERDGPPPCHLGYLCPKESPEREALHVLSRRNWRMYDAWQVARATHRFVCPDALQVRGYRVIGEVMRAQERRQLAYEIASVVLKIRGL